MSLYTIFLFCFYLFIIQTHARRRTITTETSDFFKKLKDFDLTYFDRDHSEHLFSKWEDKFYPSRGSFKFDAFGQHFHVEIEKNHKLVTGDFKVINYNGTHRTRMPWDPIKDNCFYHGYVANDENPSRVAVKACNGEGISGYIQAHGRTLAIKPSAPHLDINDDNKPRPYDEHIVYHLADVERDVASLEGGCHVGKEHETSPKEMERLKTTDPDLYDHIIKYHGSDDHDHDHDSHEDDHDSHDHDHDSHDHDHDHDSHDHDHTHDDPHRSVLELLEAESGVHFKERRKLDDIGRLRYVEMLIVNDPARTVAYAGCQEYDETETLPAECVELVQDTLQIFSTVTQLYRDQSWEFNIQLVIATIENWWDHGCALDENGDPVNANYCSGDMRPTLPEGLYPYNYGNSALQGAVGCDTYAEYGLSTNGYISDAISRGPAVYKNGEAKAGTEGYCEASYIDYLGKWHQWRLNSKAAPKHDNAQLLSYYDFYATVIGYATLRSMCASYSGGINQMTYDNEYNAGIITHEMGHNWGMRHDGDGNNCNPANFIMASSGSPNGVRPDTFSDCSTDYMLEYIEAKSATIQCLDNVPVSPEYGTCGNGFVENGEECDCGLEDCSSVDPCCNGKTCSLNGGSECSALQSCCSYNQQTGVCSIVTDTTTVCRAESDINTCDIEAEYCDGVSPECPYDKYNTAGSSCFFQDVGTANAPDGMCWDGQCRSAGSYCKEVNGFSHCYQNDIRVDDCNTVKCEDPATGNCVILNIADTTGTWPDGTPCNLNGGDGLCLYQDNGQSVCKSITQMESYQWVASAFGDCSKSCYPGTCDFIDQPDCVANGCVFTDSDSCEYPPYPTYEREVSCVKMDGTPAGESNCNSNSKPAESSTCNTFTCDTSCDLNCGDNGQCIFAAPEGATAYSVTEAVPTCECLYGFTGENCGTAPSVEWLGVASIRNQTQAPGEDPTCLAEQLQSFCGYDFHPGDTISFRWRTTGSPDNIVVGIRKPEWAYSFYPSSSGKMLFANKLYAYDLNNNYINCDNDTFASLCDDASYYFNPVDHYSGTYQFEVRYNNEANVLSNEFEISCVDEYCGAGSCGANGFCECPVGYYGDQCEYSYCQEWLFIDENVDASDPNANANVYVDRCHDHGVCNAETGICTCDDGYSGQYCEITSALTSTCGAAEFTSDCQHGSVRVFDSDSDPCSWTCDCDAEDRLFNTHTLWTGTQCETCSLDATCAEGGGVANADCSACELCDLEKAGDLCEYYYWVTNFIIDFDYNTIQTSGQRERFESTFIRDIAYSLNDNNFGENRFDIYSISPHGSGQTKVTIKLILSEGIIGAEIMFRLNALVEAPQSAWYRGLLTQHTDTFVGLEHACVPSFENCDPDAEDRFTMYFMYCAAGSFGFEIIAVLIWWYNPVSRRRRDKRYEERRAAKKKNMETLIVAQERLGISGANTKRKVSRKKARKIFEAHQKKQRALKQTEKANKEIQKQEETDLKAAMKRSKQEEEAERKSREKQRQKSRKEKVSERGKKSRSRSHSPQPRSHSHSPQPGPKSHHQHQGRSHHAASAAVPQHHAPHHQGRSHHAASAAPKSKRQHHQNEGIEMGQVGEGRPLPANWEMHTAKDGFPFYYNTQTGESRWNHPGEL